jgi:hypothetical protein
MDLLPAARQFGGRCPDGRTSAPPPNSPDFRPGVYPSGMCAAWRSISPWCLFWRRVMTRSRHDYRRFSDHKTLYDRAWPRSTRAAHCEPHWGCRIRCRRCKGSGDPGGEWLGPLDSWRRMSIAKALGTLQDFAAGVVQLRPQRGPRKNIRWLSSSLLADWFAFRSCLPPKQCRQPLCKLYDPPIHILC